MSTYDKLPLWWKQMDVAQQEMIVDDLRDGKPLHRMSKGWLIKHYSDRWAVIRYLEDREILSQAEVQALIIPQRDMGPDGVHRKVYMQPNGGQRILPPQYTGLRDTWVRSNLMSKSPDEMNDGHLENTLKLLNESHGNLVAKATLMLGTMSKHFVNCVEVRNALEVLCVLMQKTDVEEVYPVWTALSTELQGRHHKRLPIEDLIDGFNRQMDLEIENW